MIIWFKYVCRQNRETDYYDVGTKWFNTHIVTWNKWFLNKRFILVKLEKINK